MPFGALWRIGRVSLVERGQEKSGEKRVCGSLTKQCLIKESLTNRCLINQCLINQFLF